MNGRQWMATCSVAMLGASATAFAAGTAESTTISGKMFADLSNVDLENNGMDSAANGTGIDVKRFYLGVTHAFDDIWSANVTADFNYVGNDSETQIFVKKAYLQAKLSDSFIGRLGSADLPWIPFVEDIYGYRWVENVIVDRLKFGTSADWGVHAGGKVADGRFGYAASVVNGAGYKNPSRSDSMDFEGRLSFMPVAGLTLAVGGYDGKLGKDVAGAAPTQHTASRLDALVAYVAGPLRIGAEYFQAKDWNQVMTSATDKADGYSGFVSYNFSPEWGALARGDWAKPSKTLAPGLKDEYFNIGLVSHPRKNVDLALVYKHDETDGRGIVATSNGTIGATGGTGRYDEFGVWAQVAF